MLCEVLGDGQVCRIPDRTRHVSASETELQVQAVDTSPVYFTRPRLGQELPSCLLGFLPSGQKLEQQHQMSRRLNALPASAADFVDSSVQDGLTQRWDNSLPELMVGDNCLKRQLIGDDASQFSDYDAEDRPPSCASVCVPSSEQQGAKYCHKSTLVEGCTKRRTGSNRSIELHLCRVLASTVHQPKHRAKQCKDPPAKRCPLLAGRCVPLASANAFFLSRHADTKTYTRAVCVRCNPIGQGLRAPGHRPIPANKLSLVLAEAGIRLQARDNILGATLSLQHSACHDHNQIGICHSLQAMSHHKHCATSKNRAQNPLNGHIGCMIHS
mmetsp:Transcript_79252/g.181553  ORF Transcript_79252/g.181553 Transcript_79252/m.181553 type:complete len:327 (-) Transcript_79252:3459-4439(-)